MKGLCYGLRMYGKGGYVFFYVCASASVCLTKKLSKPFGVERETGVFCTIHGEMKSRENLDARVKVRGME